MKTKLMVYFAIVTSMFRFGETFGVSAETALQTATIYEAGKLTGVIIFGYCCKQWNTMTVIFRTLELFCCSVLLAIVWIRAGEFSYRKRTS